MNRQKGQQTDSQLAIITQIHMMPIQQFHIQAVQTLPAAPREAFSAPAVASQFCHHGVATGHASLVSAQTHCLMVAWGTEEPALGQHNPIENHYNVQSTSKT